MSTDAHSNDALTLQALVHVSVVTGYQRWLRFFGQGYKWFSGRA
jgi:hypothetical protein